MCNIRVTPYNPDLSFYELSHTYNIYFLGVHLPIL